MHRLSSVAVLAVVSLAFPSSALPGQDPAVSVQEDFSPEQFTLFLGRDGTRNAIYVEPRADGMVGITWADSTLEYVPLYRIKRIDDSHGADRTSDVSMRRHRLGVAIPGPLRAQRGPGAWKAFRLLAGPRSACGSYMITDCAMTLVAGHDRDANYFESFDLGYARNIGRSYSVGVTTFAGTDLFHSQAGMRLRLTHWISPEASLDLSPGVIIFGGESGPSRFLGPGFSAQAGITLYGRIGLLVDASSSRIETLHTGWGRPDFTSRTTDTAWHVGLRLGGGPGIAAAIPALLLIGSSRSVGPIY